jgi:hypothetical protein
MEINRPFVLFVYSLAISFMLAFPPFTLKVSGRVFNMGYAFILSPPGKGNTAASVDVSLLTLQIISVTLVVAAAFFALHLMPNKTLLIQSKR